MSQLVEALAARLPPGTLRLNAAVSQLRLSSNARWSVTLAGQHTPESFDGVIVAAPACAAAPMLRDQAPALADELAAIPYAPSIVVCLGYQRDQIAHRLDGFGFVVPAIENRPILAASFSSLKYPGRAPEGQVLIRVFFSVGRQRDWEHSDDGELQQVAQRELAALLGVRGEPSLCRVIRWQNAMPQYHVGHLERLARIAQRLHELPGLQLAGNAYDGVGVPQCIHSGEQAAERVVKGEE
jgi:oxygen-dependent protoporphyrinogen oxidase